jgi:ParB family chromosome partitioning protein
MLPLEQVTNNLKQPRQHFSTLEIQQLSESIKTLGVLQPILVRRLTAGEGLPNNVLYEVVAGERRWRAANLANLTKIPAFIRDLTEKEVLEIALVENIQRENLNPLEQARGFQRLIEEFGLTQNEVAERVGKDRASIANYIRLLKLPIEVQELLQSEKLTMGHTKALLGIREASAQTRLARKTVQEGLSVRELEAIVQKVVVLDSGKRPQNQRQNESLKNQLNDEKFREVTDRLRATLATKVKITQQESGTGSILIEYFSEQELDRLIEQLCR